MSVSSAFTIYAATIDGTLIDEVSSCNFAANVENILQSADGGVDPTFSAVKMAAPRITFNSMAIKTALDAIGISGANISSSAVFFFQKLSQGGTRESGSDHLKLTATAGMVVPKTISAGHDTPAEISYEAILLSDSGAEPVAIAASQALTGSPTVDEMFMAGPVTINGTTLSGVQSIDIDFGITDQTLGGDGEAYPTFASIMSRQPRITITLFDMDYLATVSLDGLAQGLTDSVVYLRKVAAGGARVADATEEHISFTIDDGIITIESGDGSNDSVAEAKIVISPVYDGTNDILVIDTTAALP